MNLHDRNIQKTCDEICASEDTVEALVARIENRLINAAWTLRRMPDREAGFLYARQVIWPEYKKSDASAATLKFKNDVRVRPTPQEIDQMQPALDLLLLLPHVEDRKLLFWAAWHQNGEKQARIPWAKVRRSLSSDQSRWTLKRHYNDNLGWLANIIALQG
jgi:hypothetical protein